MTAMSDENKEFQEDEPKRAPINTISTIHAMTNWLREQDGVDLEGLSEPFEISAAAIAAAPLVEAETLRSKIMAVGQCLSVLALYESETKLGCLRRFYDALSDKRFRESLDLISQELECIETMANNAVSKLPLEIEPNDNVYFDDMLFSTSWSDLRLGVDTLRAIELRTLLYPFLSRGFTSKFGDNTKLLVTELIVILRKGHFSWAQSAKLIDDDSSGFDLSPREKTARRKRLLSRHKAYTKRTKKKPKSEAKS